MAKFKSSKQRRGFFGSLKKGRHPRTLTTLQTKNSTTKETYAFERAARGRLFIRKTVTNLKTGAKRIYTRELR